MVETSEWRRVDREVHGAIWQRGYNLAAIPTVECVIVGDDLCCYSHDGISSFIVAVDRCTPWASRMCWTRASNIAVAAADFRARFCITDCSPGVVTISTTTGLVW